MTDFGIKVKVKLAELDMTLSKFASEMGISQPYLTDILRGRRRAVEQKKRIAKVLGISLTDID